MNSLECIDKNYLSRFYELPMMATLGSVSKMGGIGMDEPSFVKFASPIYLYQ